MTGPTTRRVLLTSREVGERIGVSQQAADRYLLALERKGLITRSFAQRRQRLALTPAAMEVLRTEYHAYRRIFEGPARLSFNGKVAERPGGRAVLPQPAGVSSSSSPSGSGTLPIPGR